MFALPAFTPVITPVVRPTVATLVLSLLQVPPGVPFDVKAVTEPAHMVELPVSVPATTVAFTVTAFDVSNRPPQPLTEYLILAVPAVSAETIPLELTVATAVLSLVHAPPAVPLLLNDVAEPTHTDEAPLITPAVAVPFTAICFVTLDVPQPLTE